MRKYLLLTHLIVFALFAGSCSNMEVGKEETRDTKLDKDEVLDLLGRKPLYIAAATRESSSGTEDLMLDPKYITYRENVFLVFSEDFVNFYGGSAITNDTIPPTARAFTLNTRIALPTNISHSWDDAKGTMLLKFKGTSSYFPMLRDNQTAYLDPEGFNLVPTYDPKTDGIPPSLKFISKENDPKLGEVTYTFTFKPMWFYYRMPGQQVYENFVVY
ncbi:hypothetical protein [Dyadobacter aurulentus]|uniref:hypothetical protein n=1 Tax=Dyadobacter sp. UC 10 TaxID=2605428 RepID=UPI0011F2F7DC|nr:hypothetical protein [Dyadobacter sp. UC 10]KAA0993464.1 hypothetical protein FXO21_26445 [Dyadobacter sp. UC 10]